jgi:hypothetical protein
MPPCEMFAPRLAFSSWIERIGARQGKVRINQKGMTGTIAARGTVTRGLLRSGFGATTIGYGRCFSP